MWTLHLDPKLLLWVTHVAWKFPSWIYLLCHSSNEWNWLCLSLNWSISTWLQIFTMVGARTRNKLLTRKDGIFGEATKFGSATTSIEFGGIWASSRLPNMKTFAKNVRDPFDGNWQRDLVIIIWLVTMMGLFTWKFTEYRNRGTNVFLMHILTVRKIYSLHSQQ